MTETPGRSKALAVMYFTNLTQDKSLDWLDHGLCEMLTTNLSQVKGMDVLSTERIAAVLDRMGKKDLTPKTAPEVARNAGAAAFVTGALMRVGPDGLRLDVRAQDTAGGQVLFSEKVEGEDVKSVFKMVDALTARMAERLLPAGSPPRSTPALEEVTTSNVEAFRHYQLGLDALRRYEYTTGLDELEQAVRLDPRFALAWLRAAELRISMNDRRSAYEIWQKLDRMRTRLPRKEQLSLQAVRADAGYDSEEEVRSREALLVEFPRESRQRHFLARIFRFQGRFARVVQVHAEAVRMDPDNEMLWNELSFSYLLAGNNQAALEANDRCRALKPGHPFPPASRGDLFFIAGRDEDAIAEYRKSLDLGSAVIDHYAYFALAFVYADQKKFSLAESTLREYRQKSKDPLILFYEAQLEEARGRLEAARDLYRRAVTEHAKADRNETAGQALMALAHISRELGESASALAFARQQKLGGEQHQPMSLLEAGAGNAAAAERSLEESGQAQPWMSERVIELFRARNQMAAALQRNELPAGGPPEAQAPLLPDPWVPFLEARAALLAKDYGSSERRLRLMLLWQRWLLATPMPRLRSPLVTLLCHFYLGQVYEATGKRDQTLAEYREFLSVFEGSTSKLPQIPEARAALKRLGAA